MSEDKRPEWPHKTPEALARWLVSGHITKITHHWEFTGEDTSRHWIVLHKHDDKESRIVDSGFLNNSPDFEFAPDHASLVRPRNYSEVRQSIEKIDRWDQVHAAERATYERLKKKFGAA